MAVVKSMLVYSSILFKQKEEFDLILSINYDNMIVGTKEELNAFNTRRLCQGILAHATGFNEMSHC